MSGHGEWPAGEAEHEPRIDRAYGEPGDDASVEEPVARLKKSPSAFRTISEVADDLHIPQHVLRFWETRFPQVKPLKRGGGRRYYRPDDIALLRRISDLLYIQGYTIKGVQRLLREGDGTLTGDLPPPDVAERDDEVLFPRKAAPPDPATAEPEPSQPPVPQPSHALEAENHRLRDMLRLLLGELEQLRADLPL